MYYIVFLEPYERRNYYALDWEENPCGGIPYAMLWTPDLSGLVLAKYKTREEAQILCQERIAYVKKHWPYEKPQIYPLNTKLFAFHLAYYFVYYTALKISDFFRN